MLVQSRQRRVGLKEFDMKLRSVLHEKAPWGTDGFATEGKLV
jgi:hypothetical protein